MRKAQWRPDLGRRDPSCSFQNKNTMVCPSLLPRDSHIISIAPNVESARTRERTTGGHFFQYEVYYYRAKLIHPSRNFGCLPSSVYSCRTALGAKKLRLGVQRISTYDGRLYCAHESKSFPRSLGSTVSSSNFYPEGYWAQHPRWNPQPSCICRRMEC